MATIIDLLRHLGQGMGPHGSNALCGPVELPASPLPAFSMALPGQLGPIWSQATAQAIAAYHALGLAASRAGEAVCFMGPGSAAEDALLLVTLAQVLAEPDSAVLWLVPDDEQCEAAMRRMEQVLSRLPLKAAAVQREEARSINARLVVATYDDLHGHLLPHADRGW